MSNDKKQETSEQKETVPPITKEQEEQVVALSKEYLDECQKIAKDFEVKLEAVGLDKTKTMDVLLMNHANIVGNVIALGMLAYMKSENIEGLTAPQILSYLGVHQHGAAHTVQSSFFGMLEKKTGFSYDNMMKEIIAQAKMAGEEDEGAGGHC